MTETAPPRTAGQRAQLAASMDGQRAVVLRKCAGLSEEQARRSLLPSPLTTIAGLLYHLYINEWYWFAVVLDGEPDVWEETFEADPDFEFRRALELPMAELVDTYTRQCERSREIVAALDLDEVRDSPRGPVTPRWVVLHMIEETARHAGHLDLLRELTDGATGV